MISLKKIFQACICILLIFSSCKNDLKLNAPYKEYPSVYAVLVPQEKLQMIRINKVFLGEGDANKMAQVSDSVNYPAGELVVTLERYLSGVKTVATPTGNKNTITFHDSVIQTAPGSFNTAQRVYVTSDKLFTWGDYVLTITNTRTKNVFTAKSASLDSITPTGFSPFSGPYYPISQADSVSSSNFVTYDKPQNNYSIRYNINDAILYQLTMRLHYTDNLPTGSSNAYVDYFFAKQDKSNASIISNQGPFLTNTFKGSDIYETVGASLEKNGISKNNTRKMYKVQFIVYSSTQDYADYLSFSAPSLSIAQEKPLYSNFDNRAALGIFTFRARHSIFKAMASEFVSQFANNRNTCKFKFITSDNLSTFCP